MRRSFLAVGAALAMAVTMALPASAGTTVAHGRWQGFNADAIFRAEEGSIVTDVDVGFATGRTTGTILPGGTNPLPAAGVSIEVHDGEALVFQAYGLVSLAPDEYTLDENKLASASLTATIPAIDADDNEFDVTVDIQWTASGPYDQQVGGFTVPSEYVTRFIGKSRQSMAATGTVSWDGTRFDCWETDAGFIMKVNYFEVTITK
jgi:hypothetical protein